MPNRVICSVLKEIRVAYDKRQYVLIPGLVEEAQTMVNRMEAALWDQNDVEHARKQLSELREERKELKKEIEELRKKAGKKPKKRKKASRYIPLEELDI